MTDELVFYTNPMSRGRIVRWMLEEVGQPYRTELLDYGPAMKSPGYLAINPMGKVPAIRHGEIVVTETAAICAYLADAFPEADLAPPAGSRARGPYYRWLFFGAGPVEATVVNKALGVAPPEGPAGRAGCGQFEDVLAVLDQALSKSAYLAGEAFTAADIYIGSQLWLATEWGAIEKRPAFDAYFQRIRTRPAALRAQEIDDALMGEHKA